MLWLPPAVREMCVFLCQFQCAPSHPGYDCPSSFLFHVVLLEAVACPSQCCLSSRHVRSFLSSIPSHAKPRFLFKIMILSIPQWQSLHFPPNMCLGGFEAVEGNRPSSHVGEEGLLISKFFLKFKFIERANMYQTCPHSSLLSDLQKKTLECAGHGWSWWEGRDLKQSAFVTSM